MDQVQEPVKDEKVINAASADGKWYIIHTYAGHENKVARSLKQRVDSMGFEDRVFDIIVPTRNTIKVSHCLLYTSPSPRDGLLSRMPSSA